MAQTATLSAAIRQDTARVPRAASAARARCARRDLRSRPNRRGAGRHRRAQQDADRHQRGHHDRGRGHRRPARGSGAHPRDPADSLRPGDIIHLDLYESRPTRRSRSRCRSVSSAFPTGAGTRGRARPLAARVGDRGPAGRHSRAHRPRRHRPGHRALALRARHQAGEVHRPQRPRHPICTVVAPRAEEAPAAAPEEAAIAEPELIRKPKAEGEDEGEAEKKA